MYNWQLVHISQHDFAYHESKVKNYLVKLIIKIQQIESGLEWSVLLATMIFLITEVIMLWTYKVKPSKSSTNFDHRDEENPCC